MLKQLRIQNFAIIDQVQMEFGPGLNIISGETGAGKSIIMDALFLILGGRASVDLIRRGASEATVEALFEISAEKKILDFLAEHGIEPEEGEIIVRRNIQSSGKSRIYINGNMATTTTLAALTSQLVDMCSQHDQQLLSRPEEQLLWIDRFGKLENSREKVREQYLVWKKAVADLDALSSDSTQRTQKIDFLRFQMQELEDAAILSASEDIEIEQDLKILGEAENLFAFSSEAETALYGGDQEEGTPILSAVTQLHNKARTLAAADPKLNEAADFLNTLKVNAEELGFFLRQYNQRIQRDEGKLESLNARHAQLTKLKRKYGNTLAEVLAAQEQFKHELSQLENHDVSLAEATERVAHARNRLQDSAKVLSSARKRAAREFAAAVEKELADLNMERAKFEACLSPLEIPNAFGADAIKFQIAANPGEPMGPLNKIASGGELSRIMLAMHNVVSSLGGVGVFLFDEVDTGIGGKTAAIVGSKLQKVAGDNQVICITHLPQVAAFASEHFHVEKSVQKKNKEERTVCDVRKLTGEERVMELARMLGGIGNSKAAMENARTMISTAQVGFKKASGAPAGSVVVAAAKTTGSKAKSQQ